MDFTKWLAAQGIDKFDELPESVQKTLKAAFEAEQLQADDDGDGHGIDDDFNDIIANRRQERDRVQAITKLVKAAVDEHPMRVDDIEKLGQQAIKGKATPQQFELELLRSLRPVGPAPFVRGGDGEVGSRAIEAAICKTLKMRDIEKQYDERTLDATDKYFRHGIGLQQLLFKAAAANGQHFDSVANMRQLLEAAFGHGRQVQAGFSTISLPGILSNVMQKLLVDYFNHVESAWRGIAAIRPVRDFKTVTQYSLTGDAQFLKLGPTGEIQHGTVGETSYTNKADTFARMLAITRHDIINDDLSAFQRVPQRLGRGGALKLNDVFWSIFLNNSAFFVAGNNNVSTGAGSALGASDGAAINAAELVFNNQTDPNGKPLGVMPRIMLVPPTLVNTAARWMGGQLIVTGADTVLPNVNVYQGRYKVVTSQYMENASYTGYSAAAWYLLADPLDMPVIEVVFLNGRDMPIVESADADFDQLGIQTRAYFDFGVALQEPRGGVRSAGS